MRTVEKVIKISRKLSPAKDHGNQEAHLFITKEQIGETKMALISIGGAYSAPKRRTKMYKASGSAYPTGGNRGYYIAALPRPYPATSQQKKVRDAARACGIKPGISKADLQRAMKECIPGKF